MPDETTTATEGQPAAGAAATATAAHPTGAGAGAGPRPDPLPMLHMGSTEDKWVLYLQQMLNYHYQSQVVTENGDYDSQTAGAVEHFRSQQNIGQGDHVDAQVWEKLGVQDPAEAWDRAHPQGGAGAHPSAGQHGAGQHGADQHGADQHGQQAEAYEPVYYSVDLIPMTHDGACWASAMAMVLNTKGNSFTVESLCEQAQIDVNDHKSASDVRSVGAQLGLQPVACNGTTPGGWAQALHTGPVWVPNPTNDNNVMVVAGVSGTGAEAIIHVLDPATSLNEWMNFAQFTQHYGFGDHHELLA